MAKLITETFEDIEYLTEESPTGAKSYFIEGVFLQANRKNKNGRIYPKELLQREAARYNKDYVVAKRAFGELGHPEGPVVNLDRVSHMIIELKEDGDNFFGKAKILDTPYGKIVKNFISEGAKLGVSSRGLGSLSQSNGVNMVQEDFYLVTAGDIVADPSAPDAFVKGIMESTEWIQKANGEYVRKMVNQIVRETPFDRSNREEKYLQLFEDYINKL